MKTISISEEAHEIIIRKQRDIYKKYRVKVNLSDLVGIIVVNNIESAEKLLGLMLE